MILRPQLEVVPYVVAAEYLRAWLPEIMTHPASPLTAEIVNLHER